MQNGSQLFLLLPVFEPNDSTGCEATATSSTIQAPRLQHVCSTCPVVWLGNLEAILKDDGRKLRPFT